MSTVQICDRCGAFGKDEVMHDLSVASGSTIDGWEICSACRLDFDHWMVVAVNSRVGQAVTEKYVNEPKISEETRMLARVVAEEFARARDNVQRGLISGGFVNE